MWMQIGRVRNLSKWKKTALWVIILCVVICIVLAVVLLTNLDGKEPEQNEKVPETTTAPTEETTQDTTGKPIERLPEKEFFTMEDFSPLVIDKSTYADLCSLMPEAQQPELVMHTDGASCEYPANDGSISIYFAGEALILKGILFSPREGSEYYPVKDISAFSFIIPGKTTLKEVLETVPHPAQGIPATGSGLSWIDYAVVDGSVVRIHFYLQPDRRGIIHSVEIVKNEETQSSKAYPLVFADINEERVKVSVFAYVSEGKLLTTDMFSYSGRPLSDYLEEPADVTSDILPEGTKLAFVNKKWGSFRANTTGLFCEGEMMYGDIWVYANIDYIPNEKGYYLGAPSGVKLYPNSVACRDDGFTMDLNADNRIDSVSWTFSQSEEGDDLFDYAIKVKVGDHEQVIVNEDGFPCGKEDLSVWPIDLEQDGIYELVIYNKSFSMFGDLRIYKLNGTTYEKQLIYIFENMP